MKYLVYDIGGSFIKYAIINSERDILQSGKMKTPKDSLAQFVTCVKEVYDTYGENVEGIAISMPGKIDVFNGYAHTAGLLTYLEQTNIVSLFHTFTNKAVSVENDGKCVALAESWCGTLQDVDCGIALVFGSGVGGGLIIDRKLHRGFNGIAGEFSFIRDEKGMFGGSGSVIVMLKNAAKELDIATELLNGEMFFDLINNNNPIAKKHLQAFCDTIAQKLYNLQYIIDPQIIAIGGGISVQEVFLQELNASIERYYQTYPFQIQKPTIVPCTYRSDANLLGALMNHHLNKVKR